MTNRLALAMLVLTSLTACDDQATQGPGGVSAEDAKALDEAAEKLDTETTIQQQP